MNYEKSYKDALNRAKVQLVCTKVCEYKNEDTAYDIVKTICNIFPELTASEDEIMRKSLIDYLKERKSGESYGQYVLRYDHWITWLEKQSEQNHSWNEEESDNKPTWELVREFIQKCRMPKDEDELNCLVQYVIDNKNK